MTDGYRIDVRVTSYVRGLGLLVAKVAADAVVDDMLISLTAGETHHLTTRTSKEMSGPAALLHLAGAPLRQHVGFRPRVNRSTRNRSTRSR